MASICFFLFPTKKRFVYLPKQKVRALKRIEAITLLATSPAGKMHKTMV